MAFLRERSLEVKIRSINFIGLITFDSLFFLFLQKLGKIDHFGHQSKDLIFECDKFEASPLTT